MEQAVGARNPANPLELGGFSRLEINRSHRKDVTRCKKISSEPVSNHCPIDLLLDLSSFSKIHSFPHWKSLNEKS